MRLSRPLILASRSPRRRDLLKQAGYAFQVIPPHDDAECGVCSGESVHEMAARLARQKAESVARRVNEGLVLGCDTVVHCMGRILGKPRDEEHARRMLLLLRGREHQVVSGLCLWWRPEDRVQVEIDVTRLFMEPVTDQQIEQYLETDGWVGKAGAFGYQDGLPWIRVLEGSESNVVGLPMELLERMLADQAR